MALSVARAGGKTAWIVPEFKNSDPLWRWTLQALGDARASGAVRVLETKRSIEFPNNGFLGLYSADNNADSVRGDWFHLVVLDEAAKITKRAWEDAIRPTVADVGGDMVLISTPAGRNWFWQEWENGRLMNDEIASFIAPTSDNPNPTIRKEFEIARRTLSERSFRQEWCAEFVEDGGGVFRGLNRVCVLEPAEPEEDHLYTVGVDWGRSNDYTAISVIDITPRPARQVKLDRFSQIGYEIQLGRLRAILDAYQPIAIVAELNSMGGPLVERLQMEGYPVEGFQTTSASKKLLVEDYALAIERADVMLLNDETQKLELESIQGETLPGGMIRYAAPDTMHDDTMIAGALAWQRAKGDYLTDEEETEEEQAEREWEEQLVKRGVKLEKKPGLGDPRRGRR